MSETNQTPESQNLHASFSDLKPQTADLINALNAALREVENSFDPPREDGEITQREKTIDAILKALEALADAVRKEYCKHICIEDRMAGAVQDNKGFGGMGQHFKDSEKMKNIEEKIKRTLLNQGRVKIEPLTGGSLSDF
jgi:hypothetical protein